MSMTEEQSQLFVLPEIKVSRIRVKHTGIKDVDSIVNGNRYVPTVGDRGRTLVEWVVESVQTTAKRNAQGQAIGPMTAIAQVKALAGGVEIMAVEPATEDKRITIRDL